MKHINALFGQHAELQLGFEWLRNYKERSQYDNYARDWTTSWFDSRMRQEMCLFSETCRPHSLAHPPSYSVCSGGYFPGRKSNDKPLSRAEAKNEWSCIWFSSCVPVPWTGTNLPLFTDEIKAVLVALKATEERSKVKCSCRCLVKFPRNTSSTTTTTSGDCSSSFLTFSVNMAHAGHTVRLLKRLATGWTARGSNPGGGEIFRTHPDRPWGQSCLLYNG
jgi:hypothetical protein